MNNCGAQKMPDNDEIGFRLPKIMTMATVAETRQAYLALGAEAGSAIDASGIESIDLVGLQLLVVLLATGSEAQRPRLSTVSAPVEQALARAGFSLPTMQ